MKGLQFFGNRVEDAANAFIDVLKYSDQSVDIRRGSGKCHRQ